MNNLQKKINEEFERIINETGAKFLGDMQEEVIGTVKGIKEYLLLEVNIDEEDGKEIFEKLEGYNENDVVKLYVHPMSPNELSVWKDLKSLLEDLKNWI